MNIDNIRKYIPDVKLEHLEKNVDVEVISCYGGMTCMIIPINELELFVKEQEREFGIDYIFYIEE